VTIITSLSGLVPQFRICEIAYRQPWNPALSTSLVVTPDGTRSRFDLPDPFNVVALHKKILNRKGRPRRPAGI